VLANHCDIHVTKFHGSARFPRGYTEFIRHNVLQPVPSDLWASRSVRSILSGACQIAMLHLCPFSLPKLTVHVKQVTQREHASRHAVNGSTKNKQRFLFMGFLQDSVFHIEIVVLTAQGDEGEMTMQSLAEKDYLILGDKVITKTQTQTIKPRCCTLLQPPR
jgi:hypothetical protein